MIYAWCERVFFECNHYIDCIEEKFPMQTHLDSKNRDEFQKAIETLRTLSRKWYDDAIRIRDL